VNLALLFGLRASTVWEWPGHGWIPPQREDGSYDIEALRVWKATVARRTERRRLRNLISGKPAKRGRRAR